VIITVLVLTFIFRFVAIAVMLFTEIFKLYHYATSLKVAGSIVYEVIGFFSLPNTSRRTMALGSTQPLTEMSTKNLPVGKGRPTRKADKPYRHL
jgi:hypothetical protein